MLPRCCRVASHRDCSTARRQASNPVVQTAKACADANIVRPTARISSVDPRAAAVVIKCGHARCSLLREHPARIRYGPAAAGAYLDGCSFVTAASPRSIKWMQTSHSRTVSMTSHGDRELAIAIRTLSAEPCGVPVATQLRRAVRTMNQGDVLRSLIPTVRQRM